MTLRPVLHPTAPTGWLNDPNGSVFVDGTLHVFHQWHPHDVTFGPMEWGHFVSDDLVTWRHEGAALSPGSVDALDAAGCWSGCASQGAEGLEFDYTAVAGDHHGTQRPRLALPSKDLLHLVPTGGYLAEPPDEFSPDFRDPFVWGEAGQRRMLMAGRTARLEPVICVLREAESGWQHDRLLSRDDGLELPGWLWECAQLVTDGDAAGLVVSCMEGEDERVSVWSAVGSPDLTDWRDPGPLDDSGRFYAAQTFPHPDGRTLMMGWVRTQDDHAAIGADRVGALSLLREVTIADGRVHQRPVRELESMRLTLSLSSCDERSAEFDRQHSVEVIVAGVEGDLTLVSDDRDWVLPLGVWTRGAPARVFFDTGIVEVFAAGRSSVVTDLGFPAVSGVRLECGTLSGVYRLAVG